jgi:flagellar hook assembly protein FlgD
MDRPLKVRLHWVPEEGQVDVAPWFVDWNEQLGVRVASEPEQNRQHGVGSFVWDGARNINVPPGTQTDLVAD